MHQKSAFIGSLPGFFASWRALLAYHKEWKAINKANLQVKVKFILKSPKKFKIKQKFDSLNKHHFWRSGISKL